jgi:Protein of unknown function (DUF1566)/Secretion system C-terminal sorting domain
MSKNYVSYVPMCFKKNDYKTSFSMKKALFILPFVLMATFVNAQNSIKSMLKLPDTGQIGDFTTTFGEDADYSINVPFFIKNNNGTVTDTITGLMWQQTDGGEMTVENAAIYADALVLGGFSDWRLPTAHESFSILNHQKNNPALDITIFTTSAAEYWWTSDKQANDATKIWCTNAGGGIGNHPKLETISAGGLKKYHARAVRDVKTPPTVANQFTDNANGTIKDNLTGLTWQKAPNLDTLTWENALVYAEGLTLSGFSDWRLPNIKELESINDERIVNPSVSTTYFTTIGVKKYWSSTSLPNQTTRAWYLSTQFGITTYELKTARQWVICVRGNSSNTTALKESNSPIFPIKVFPNPIRNKALQFEIADNSMDLDVKVVDNQGRILRTQKYKAHEYDRLISLPIFDLNSGIYWLNLDSNGGKKSEKITVFNE